MKKIIIIVVLLCFSTFTNKTEADEIKNTYFQQFFAKFQKDLKESNGKLDSTITNYFDSNLLDGYNENQLKEFFNSLHIFTFLLEKESGEICSLSESNNYNSRDIKDSIRWNLIKYSSSPVHGYRLERHNALDDNISSSNFYCDFHIKNYNNNEWKINNISIERILSITFKPNNDSVLTKEDVDNTLKQNNLTRKDLKEKFDCIIDNSVTKIEKRVFDYITALYINTLTLPPTLISISDSAFFGCEILGKLYIPSSVEEIGDCAFGRCYDIETIEFAPNSKLKKIGKGAFSRHYDENIIPNKKLKKIVIPSSVEEIGDCAFDGFENLEILEFAPNSKLKKIGERAFYNSGNINKKIKRIIIPSSVEEIGDLAFAGYENLETVEFASNSRLKKIGDNPFAYSKIKKIVIPSSVEELKNTFDRCENLETVEFAPNSRLKKIGDAAFAFSKIRKIIIPASVEIIDADYGNSSFNCEYLEEVEFAPNSQLRKIKHAFVGCGIKKIVIPSSVEELGKEAFFICKNLETVEFALNSRLKKIGGHAFVGCGIKKMIIPSSVEEIGDYAFSNCENLETVEFAPNSQLEKIGGHAFEGCYGITEMTFPKNLKSIGEYIPGICITANDKALVSLQKITFQSTEPPAFDKHFLCLRPYFRLNKVLTIKVPKGSKKKYKTYLDVIIQEQVIEYFRKDLNRIYFSDKEAAVISNLIKIVE